MNEFDDFAGEYDDVDLELCNELFGPVECAEEDDWLDCDEEDEE